MINHCKVPQKNNATRPEIPMTSIKITPIISIKSNGMPAMVLTSSPKKRVYPKYKIACMTTNHIANLNQYFLFMLFKI